MQKKYRKLIQNIEAGQVFESEEEEEWECRKCGYVHKGKKALKGCPACNHPQAYFERKKKNYWPPLPSASPPEEGRTVRQKKVLFMIQCKNKSYHWKLLRKPVSNRLIIII